jgi:hypothetical protein
MYLLFMCEKHVILFHRTELELIAGSMRIPILKMIATITTGFEPAIAASSTEASSTYGLTSAARPRVSSTESPDADHHPRRKRAGNSGRNSTRSHPGGYHPQLRWFCARLTSADGSAQPCGRPRVRLPGGGTRRVCALRLRVHEPQLVPLARGLDPNERLLGCAIGERT